MAIWDHLLNGTGWNEVGTTLRISRLISLSNFLDPECPKWGPTKKGQKMAKNSFFATQIDPEGPFWIRMGGKMLENQ